MRHRVFTELAVVGLVVSGLAVAEPAAAAQRVTLAKPTVKRDAVILKGRASKPRVRVRLQQRTTGRWVNVASRKTNRKGRFKFRRALPSVDTRYRAKWRKRTSRTRVVNAWISFARPSVSGDTATLTGRTSKPRVHVRLQQQRSGTWVNVASRTSNRTGRFSFRQAVTEGDTRYRARWYRQTSRARVVRGQDDCGVRPRKSDGSLWSCTLVDEFDGTELDRSVWTAAKQRGRGDELACNLDDPRTVAVRSGALHLTVRRVSDTLKCPVGPDLTRNGNYASGSVHTQGKFTQKYGRFEARYKSTVAHHPGLHEAFWLWPIYDPLGGILWPEAGEIDIAETYSQYPNLVVPFLHYGKGGGPVPGVNTAYCAAQRGVWNTYVLEWAADRLVISVNGKRCLVHTTSAESFRKRFFINLTQLIGRGENAYDGSAPLPATMEVAYVKVWR